MFRFLSWLRRRSNPGGQTANPSQQVTVQLADGQLAHGRVVEQRADGEGGDGPYHPTIVMVGQPAGPGPQYPRRRWHRFIPRWAKWTIAIVIVLVFFRRIAAWAALAVLSAGLHLFGANVHLPHISFGWPWSSATTTNTMVGPIVLQKIEGIDKPALGTDELQLRLHQEGDEESGLPALLVLRDLLRGRPGIRDGRSEPGRRLVETVRRSLPAAGA